MKQAEPSAEGKNKIICTVGGLLCSVFWGRGHGAASSLAERELFTPSVPLCPGWVVRLESYLFLRGEASLKKWWEDGLERPSGVESIWREGSLG